MKRFLLVFVLMASLSTMVVSDVYARRFGGGMFGRQSANVSRMYRSQPAAGAAQQRQQPAANKQAQQQTKQQGANTPKQGSRFGGILGGALLGLGLGALLSHLGISGDFAGMISMILMFTILYFVARMILRMASRRPQPAYHPQINPTSYPDMNGPDNTPQIGSGLSRQGTFSASGLANPPASAELEQPLTWDIPEDFEVNSFIRSAKSYFIRFQAAWDKANLDDIYEFTTPEMFAEVKLQLQERGASSNITDVVSLDAELLGIETIGNEYFASVKFSGTVREDESEELTVFAEVWNLTRPTSAKEGWVLAGVQQIS